eukprot:365480-Chlamydomonas_euryale.AAC.10
MRHYLIGRVGGRADRQAGLADCTMVCFERVDDARGLRAAGPEVAWGPQPSWWWRMQRMQTCGRVCMV